MDTVEKEIALLDENMKITNTLCYCANHLKDCPYFAIKYLPEQIQNIIDLALTISTLKKHIAISYIDEDEDEKEDSISTTSTHTSGLFLKKQSILFQYIVIFRWIENPEIKELFHFISPYLKLPNQISLSNCILMNATNEVQTTIKDLACNDKIGVTIAFDSWCNVINQKLMGVVFIISSGEILIWEQKILVLKDKTDTDDNEDEDSFLKADWDVVINGWEELLIEKKFKEEQDDLDNVDIDFLNSEIHPAENQA
ncbi:26248_t:CDS:2, partial [Gigaspora rosea]